MSDEREYEGIESVWGNVPDDCVLVIHGVYAWTLPLVGRTVDEVRAAVESRGMKVHRRAVPIVEGELAAGATVLAAGQTVQFLLPRGEMGEAAE